MEPPGQEATGSSLARDPGPSRTVDDAAADELLRYRALFDNPVFGVRVSAVAAGGHIIDSNAAYQRMTGYSAAELRARTLLDVTHPDDRAHNRELYEQLAAGRTTSYQIEKRLLRRDGSSFWVRLTAVALLGPDGRATHHLGLVEDIDDRRRTLDELAQTSERLRAVLDSAVDGIVIIDKEGTIQQVNPSVQKMFGYAPEELLGQNVKLLMPSPYRDEHDGYLERYGRTGEARIIGIGRQVEGRRRDGCTFPLDLAVSEVRHGKELFFLGTLRDIGERLRLEGELRQGQKMEAVGRLAGGVAHDFNTLLGTILGYSEMLLSRLPPAEASRAPVERIHRAAQRGAQLTRQLLQFSRRQEITAQQIDLQSVLAEIDTLLDRLVREDVRLRLDVERGLGRVWGDAGEMHQLLLNLVVNACDAMPEGGSLTIALHGLEAAAELPVVGGRLPPGTYVRLEVTDTGTGMDERLLARIFEPFFTTKEPGKGTGLGLAMVHAAVKRSKGGIAVRSRPGQGTTFQVYFPVAAPATGEPPIAAVPAAAAGEAAEPASGRATILLVEDDDMFRELMRQVLANHGYSVLAAPNPEVALALAEASGAGVELLLSDVIMPGGTGADLARQLTARQPGMKVVLMSGYTDDVLSDRQPDRSLAHAFLEKPFPTSDLLRLLADLLQPA